MLGNSNATIINTLTSDMIKTSEKSGKIGFSDDIFEAFTVLRKFNYEKFTLAHNLLALIRNYVMCYGFYIAILWR